MIIYFSIAFPNYFAVITLMGIVQYNSSIHIKTDAFSSSNSINFLNSFTNLTDGMHKTWKKYFGWQTEPKSNLVFYCMLSCFIVNTTGATGLKLRRHVQYAYRAKADSEKVAFSN